MKAKTALKLRKLMLMIVLLWTIPFTAHANIWGYVTMNVGDTKRLNASESTISTLRMIGEWNIESYEWYSDDWACVQVTGYEWWCCDIKALRPREGVTVTFKCKYRGAGGWTESMNHCYVIDVRDNSQPTSIDLSSTSISLQVGGTKQLSASVLPSNAPQGVSWSVVSGSSYVSVSSSGLVTAKAAGTATVRATSTEKSSVYADCTVKVTNSSTPDPDPNPDPVVPTGISLPASQSVQVGSTITLTPTITPSNASTTLTWDSSDKTVATVSSGKVSGKSVGTTTITVKTSNNKTASCTVTVTPVEPTGISLPESMTVAVGDFISVTPTITPSNAETTLKWSSNDESIAIAYANGMIEGVKVGTTRIKVVTANNLVAWSTVYVKPAPESIAFSSESIDILEGDTITLTPTLMPSDAVSTLTWRSEDTSIATVTSEGVVEGIEAGTTRIWVETSNWLSASCIVTVTSSPIIQFADANVKALCVANWDTNGDGELSEIEAAVVTELGEVFKNNKEITSFNELHYFTGLTSIGDYAFRGCSGLTSVNIPNSVTRIGYMAFYWCTSLTSVTIGSDITNIGIEAFSGCESLTSVHIHITDLSAWCRKRKFFDYLGLGYHLYLNDQEITDLVIPESVTSIEMDAFYGCISLTSITIPASVTSIGYHAFRDCRGLTSIEVESGNTVYDSRNNCNAIIETASNTLIAGCMNTFIPESVTSIGYYAFSGCRRLTSVTIPNSVTSIGEYAFWECTGLTSVTIPSSVTSIGERAFAWCQGLTSVTIPESVTSIGYWTFYACRGLTSVTIGSGVTSIDTAAFGYCHALQSIICYAKETPEVDDNTFENITEWKVTLQVPRESVQKYKDHPVWGKFKIEVIDGIDVTLGDLTGDGKVSITDIVMIVDVIAGDITDANQVAAADVNGDGKVSITDCSAAVDLIAAGTSTPSSARKKANAMLSDTDFISGTLHDGLLCIDLEAEHRFTAFQMTVSVPEGMTLGNGSMNAQRGADHLLTVRNLGGGRYLVAGFSADNEDLTAGNGCLLTLATEGQADADIVISDIEFATTQAEAYYLADAAVSSTPTGLNSIVNGEMVNGKWFDLQGRRVTKATKGIYIHNGKKTVIK